MTTICDVVDIDDGEVTTICDAVIVDIDVDNDVVVVCDAVGGDDVEVTRVTGHEFLQ